MLGIYNIVFKIITLFFLLVYFDQRNKFNENHEQYLQILETMAKRFSVTDETAVI